MAYSTTQLARQAMEALNPIINGLRVNDLNAYVGDNSRVRQDFIRDEDYIRNALNKATNAAYDVNQAQALQNAINAEDTSYANTKNAIAEMRRNLVGSASSGANVGAANATALQALLGLGQQNAQTTTEGLRNLNNVSRQRAAALAQNAVTSINTANEATKSMYDAATSAYGSDRSYAAQGAAQAMGELAAAADTAASQERQVADTNATNERMNTYTADKGLEGTKYTADKGLEGTMYSSDNDLKGTMYTADSNLQGTKYTADANKEATIYSADKNLEGTKYNADKNFKGTTYSADKGLEGTKYASDKSVEAAKESAHTTSNNVYTNIDGGKGTSASKQAVKDSKKTKSKK